MSKSHMALVYIKPLATLAFIDRQIWEGGTKIYKGQDQPEVNRHLYSRNCLKETISADNNISLATSRRKCQRSSEEFRRVISEIFEENCQLDASESLQLNIISPRRYF